MNPRGAGEPLGCYMLRMFQYGILGARGLPGIAGINGRNGNTPYVQVLFGFNQPAVGQVIGTKVQANPTILPGEDVFLEGSGWYEILNSDGLGNVTMTLRIPVVNPGPFVEPGTFLIPSGKIGVQGVQGRQGIQGIKGQKGNQGIQGPIGPTGATGSTVTIPTIIATIPTFAVNWPGPGSGSGYQGGFTTSAFTPVSQLPGNVPCQVTLAKPGAYLFMANMGWGATPLNVGPGQTGLQANPGINKFKLHNVTTNADIAQSLIEVYTTGMMVTVAETLTPNNIVQVYAEAVSGAGVISVFNLWAFKIA